MYLRDTGIEQSALGLDDLQVAAALRSIELLGVLYVLLVYLHLLLVDDALLGTGVISQQGIAHLVASLQDGLLEGVQRLLLLSLGHLQSGHYLSVLEDGLRQRTDSRQEPLTGVDDGTAQGVGEHSRSTDINVGIEARTGCLHVIEALCQLHLGSMDVGTVAEQLDAYASGKRRGERLVVERATRYLVTGLVEQQAHGVLQFAYLLADRQLLPLHAIVAGLGTLHAGAAGTSQFHLQFHHVPGLFGQRLHVGDDGQLLVEHHQRVVEVGHATDDVGLHGHLIVLGSQQLHLGRALLRQDIAEEVYVPRGLDGQLIGLRRRSAVHLHPGDGTAGSDGDRRQEGQLGHLEHVLHHLHVEGCVTQVDVVLQCLLDERLQLRVSEHLAPGKVAEVLVTVDLQRITIADDVAHQSRGVQILGTLIFVVESAAGKQQGCNYKIE